MHRMHLIHHLPGGKKCELLAPTQLQSLDRSWTNVVTVPTCLGPKNCHLGGSSNDPHVSHIHVISCRRNKSCLSSTLATSCKFGSQISAAASHEREAIMEIHVEMLQGPPSMFFNPATKFMKNLAGDSPDIDSYYYMNRYESAFFVIPCRLKGLGDDIKVVACRARIVPLTPMQLWQSGNAV